MTENNTNNQVEKNGKELVRDKNGRVVSGVLNPTGRPPKGYSITAWFKKMLSSKPEIRDAIGKSIIKKALDGDATAQKMVWNYMDGMPEQSGKQFQSHLTQININDMKLEYLDNEGQTIEVAEPSKKG